MIGTLARSSIQTGFMLGLRVATQAVVLMLLTRLLGPNLYGNFVAVASLAVMLGLLPNLGAGFLMLARRARDATGLAAVWRYAWPMSVLLGLVLLIIFVLLARLVTPEPLPTNILVALGAAELLMTPFTMLFSFALQSCDRVPRSQFVMWVPLGLRIAAASPCFWFVIQQRLPAYAALQFAASTAGVVFGYLAARPYISLDWRPRMATREELREGASYAAMHLIAANPSELDKIIAARAVGSHDAGIYSATARLMASAIMPIIALLLAAQPRLFRHAYKPNPEGYKLIGLIAFISLIFGTIAAIFLILCSPILPILFGESFAATAKLLPWLAAVAPFLSLRLASGTILVAWGRPFARISFELCGIVTLVAGMLLLAPHFGVRGLAAALFIAEATMTVIGWSLVIHRLRSAVSQ